MKKEEEEVKCYCTQCKWPNIVSDMLSRLTDQFARDSAEIVLIQRDSLSINITLAIITIAACIIAVATITQFNSIESIDRFDGTTLIDVGVYHWIS